MYYSRKQKLKNKYKYHSFTNKYIMYNKVIHILIIWRTSSCWWRRWRNLYRGGWFRWKYVFYTAWWWIGKRTIISTLSAYKVQESVKCYITFLSMLFVWFLFNATFNNISVISWRFLSMYLIYYKIYQYRGMDIKKREPKSFWTSCVYRS